MTAIAVAPRIVLTSSRNLRVKRSRYCPELASPSRTNTIVRTVHTGEAGPGPATAELSRPAATAVTSAARSSQNSGGKRKP